MSGEIPKPADHTQWPSWFYPPDTREEDPSAHGRIFNSAEDVPEGWAADWRAHGANLNREPPPAKVIEATRTELKYELTKRDIPYPPTAAKAELQRLLDAAMADEVLEDSI